MSPLQGKFTELLSHVTFGRWGTEGLCRIQDFNHKGLFQQQLDLKIYNNKDLNHAIPSFEMNIMAVLFLDVVMILALFSGLKRLGQSRD
ncbi:MAG: hypothetical protein ACOYOA_00135 [Saprospiraceae bacterium]